MPLDPHQPILVGLGEAVHRPGDAHDATEPAALMAEATRAALADAGVDADLIHKIREGRPNVLDLLTDKKLDLVVNTPSGRGGRTDEGKIRASAVQHGVPCITTLSGAAAALHAIERIRARGYDVRALQDYLAG